MEVASCGDLNASKSHTDGKLRNMYQNVQIKDFIKARSGKQQYEGNLPNYPVPDQSMSSALYKIHGQTDWKNNKRSKVTILAEIGEKIKKAGGKNMGPTDYPWDKQPVEGKCTKRYLWDKEKRETFLQTLSKKEKLKKGPADYKNDPKTKILGNYLVKTEKGSLMNEIAYLSNQSPSPTHYKPVPELLSRHERSPNANLNRCRSERPTNIAFKKQDAPNPFSYPDKDTNWKKLSWIEDTSSPFIFRKE